MLQQYRVENRHHQRAITRLVQAVALRVGQADRHHIGQIAVVDLLQEPLAHAVRPVAILAADHEENRNEKNNEKIND